MKPKNINELISNKKLLEDTYNRYLAKALILKSKNDLSKAHLAKSSNNIDFSIFLIESDKFLDWAVVGLYYAVYHASLALLSRKGYSSKDHNATLCFLIKNFSNFSKEEIDLIDELSIDKQDIEFYAGLKEERKKASYSTSLLFDKEKVITLKDKTILLINKIRTILD